VAKRIQLFIVLSLGFIATGVQWDVLQAMAWGRMMANYSCAESLPQAVADTFQGPACSLCRAVAQAKQQEKAPASLPTEKLSAKVLLFFQATPRFVIAAPGMLGQVSSVRPVHSRDRAMPPVPPPRFGSV
jgi:hypothetical protein